MTYLDKLKRDTESRLEFESFEAKQKDILNHFVNMVNKYGEQYLNALEDFNIKFEESYSKPIKFESNENIDTDNIDNT
jgi:hypothetical protein